MNGHDRAKSGLELSLASRADAQHIAVMSRDLIENGLQWSWRTARIVRQIRHRDALVLTARLEDRLTGFAIMHFGDDYAHLNLLAVQPEYQRLGIGRRLVEWLEKSARVAGIFTVHLEVRAKNYAARRFYRTLGYQDDKLIPRYYDGREAAIRMIHRLCVS